MNFPYPLLEKEVIIQDIKPLPQLKWYFFFYEWKTLITLIVVAEIVWWIVEKTPLPFGWFPLGIGALLSVPLAYLIAKCRYKWQHYWITNQRVIEQQGLIGYKIKAVPFKRISDIILTRSWLEKLLGFGSLHIQTLAGQISAGVGGAEISMLALPQPEETQQLLFRLIKSKLSV